jgi:hypothetical protein
MPIMDFSKDVKFPGTILCEKCHVHMSETFEPCQVAGKYRRKQECPICHGRIFSLVSVAVPKDDSNEEGVDKVLKCARCGDNAGSLHLSQQKESEMICIRCRSEEIESEENRAYRVLKSILSY